MKKVAIISLVVFGVLSLPLAYSTFNGYLTWYWRNSDALVLVNGLPNGYVHGSGDFYFVTRTDVKKRSYRVWQLDDGSAGAALCGRWVAPDWIVFAIGDVNPPCSPFDVDEGGLTRPESPASKPIVAKGTIRFTTRDGKQIQVTIRKPAN
jgi:hypothetical protein